MCNSRVGAARRRPEERRGPLRAPKTRGGRSDPVLPLGTHVYKCTYSPAALYTAPCTNAPFSARTPTRAGRDDVAPRGPAAGPGGARCLLARSCSCHAQNCLRELRPGARACRHPGPAGRRPCRRMHPSSCLQLLCQYSNAFSRVIGSLGFGFFFFSPVYNGKGFQAQFCCSSSVGDNTRPKLSVTII